MVRSLRRLAEKLEVPLKELKICYEAGPTGFVLARQLNRMGVSCVMMAPSKTEHPINTSLTHGHR